MGYCPSDVPELARAGLWVHYQCKRPSREALDAVYARLEAEVSTD